MALFHDDVQKNKTKEEHSYILENQYQNEVKQDVMDGAFLDQNASMNAEASLVMSDSKYQDAGQIQAVQQKTQALQGSFGEMDKKKVKAVDEPPIEPDYKYVTIAKYNQIESGDSDKMVAVKEAVNRYHELRGADKQWNEIAVLEEVVKACNAYTSGKFSLFKFGKAAVRLKEVKQVRADAQAKIKEIRKKDEEKGITPSQRFQKSYKQMIKNEDRYSAEIHSAHKFVADTRTGKDKQILKVHVKNLRSHYPAMSYDEAEQLIIRFEFFKEQRQLDLSIVDRYVSKGALESAQKKRQKDREKESKIRDKQINEAFDRMTKEKFEEYLKNRNPIARIFYRIFPWGLETQIMQDTLMSLAFAKGIDLNEIGSGKSSKRKRSGYNDDEHFV